MAEVLVVFEITFGFITVTKQMDAGSPKLGNCRALRRDTDCPPL